MMTSFCEGDEATPPVKEVRSTVTAALVLFPTIPPTYTISPNACEPDGLELGDEEGDELGEEEGDELGLEDGEELGDAELEPVGLALGEEEGDEDDTATVLIICAALTKLAFSKMSISSIFKAAPSIRVFSSRMIPP